MEIFMPEIDMRLLHQAILIAALVLSSPIVCMDDATLDLLEQKMWGDLYEFAAAYAIAGQNKDYTAETTRELEALKEQAEHSERAYSAAVDLLETQEAAEARQVLPAGSLN